MMRGKDNCIFITLTWLYCCMNISHITFRKEGLITSLTIDKFPNKDKGNKVVLRSLCDDKIITRVVHDEKENGLYIVYKGIKYYDMYHIKY